MSHPFNIFQQIITGTLSPLHFSEDSLKDTRWSPPLSKTPTNCTKQTHVQFALESGQPTIRQLRTHLLDKNRLPAFLALNHTVHPDQSDFGNIALTQTLAALSLDKKNVLEWYHWRDEQDTLHLELYANYPLSSLNFEELRYHYYQLLLNTQVTQAQQRMVHTVHSTTSAKKTSKYVQDYQQALITYTTQVLQQLDEEQPQVYTLSGAYSFSDVYKLIFFSLEELMGFVEQQFTQYLDVTAPIPYRHKVLQASRLIRKLTALRPMIINSSVTPDLLAVLDQPFDQINDLARSKVTYLQLRYYRKLLQSLEAWVQEEKVNDDSLLTLLFHLNFNSTALLRWFTNMLQDKLGEQEEVAEKLSLLYYYRKSCKQLTVQRKYAYRASYASIDKRILSWIEEEITYWQAHQAITSSVPDLLTDTVAEQQNTKIKTNLSVPQIALLIRMFLNDKVAIFPEQNQNNIYRQASSILQSTRQEDISEKSLRDRYYKADKHSISVLKDKVIAMRNYLNGLP